jgi:hypothetical protein
LLVRFRRTGTNVALCDVTSKRESAPLKVNL